MNARHVICVAGIVTAITASTFVARPLNLVAQSDSQAAGSQEVEAQRQAKGKSATLQHLEQLYSKSGRQMPPMEIRQLPSTAPVATNASRGRDLSRRPSPPSRSRNPFAKLISFGKRLVNRDAAAKPPSPLRTNEGRSISPESAERLRATADSRLAERQKPRSLPQTIRRPRQQQLQKSPTPAQVPRPTSNGSKTMASRPTAIRKAIPREYSKAIPREPADSEKNTVRQANNQVVEFPDPFPDVSEEEADRLIKRLRQQKRAEVAIRKIPATSRKIPATPPASDAAESDEQTANDVSSHEEESSGEVRASEDASPASENEAATENDGLPPESVPIESIDSESDNGESSGEAKTDVASEDLNRANDHDAEPAVDLPSSASAATTPDTSNQNDHSAKLQKIAARMGKSGLKGFCPVILRDERELIDTNPEFSSTYNSKTYHLSSAAAKAEFDADPASYVPVSDGNDVVLLEAIEEEVEGTLDYAVWYRDRMYLFSSEKTMRIFSRKPAKYTSGGEEKQTFPDDLPE